MITTSSACDRTSVVNSLSCRLRWPRARQNSVARPVIATFCPGRVPRDQPGSSGEADQRLVLEVGVKVDVHQLLGVRPQRLEVAAQLGAFFAGPRVARPPHVPDGMTTRPDEHVLAELS